MVYIISKNKKDIATAHINVNYYFNVVLTYYNFEAI